MAVRSVHDQAGQQQPAVIPRLTTGPLWSVRPAPIIIEVAGWEFEIPHHSAADWLEVLLVDAEDIQLADIIPGMLGAGDAGVFEDLIWDEVIGIDDVDQLCLDVLATAAGRPWWVAMGIVASARARWDIIGGELVLSGILAEGLTLAAWLDAAFTVCVQSLGRDQKALQQWLDRLAEPPKGVTREKMDEGMDMASFTAMM